VPNHKATRVLSLMLRYINAVSSSDSTALDVMITNEQLQRKW